MPITVNADDFGISQEVNRAIEEAFAKGLINRTTLMVNMPYADEAMEIAREKGFLDRVGLHVNLTAGKPLTSSIATNPVMCNENGEFTADFARNMKTRFFLDGKSSKDVADEVTAQLIEYERLEGSLWHVDSHHHVHTDPSIWKVIRSVVKSFPVSSIRLGRNMYKGGNPLMHLFKILLNSSIRRRCNVREDYFGSMEDFKNWTCNMSDDEVNKFIQDRNIEVMVHPMYDASGRLTDSEEDFIKII